ncbi:MAG: hypothetical protein ACYC8V_14795 [Caulobacteraceae bacterium]
MSLSDLASIGSFASGVAVLASLIYLALQVRQNTHAHRVTAHQDRLTFVRDFLARIADPFMRGWLLGMAEIVWLRQRGVLDEDRFAGSMEALRGYLGFPGCRAVWPIIKPVMPVAFQSLVEKTIAATEESSAHAALEAWRSAIEGAGARN